MATAVQPRPIFKRVKVIQPSTYAPTPKAIEILIAIKEYRFLTSEQVDRIVFGVDGIARTTRSRCRDLLRELFHQGYVTRRRLPIFDRLGNVEQNLPLVYFIDLKGAWILSNLLDQNVAQIGWTSHRRRIRYPHLRHDMAINDVRIALNRSCLTGGYELVDWDYLRGYRRYEELDRKHRGLKKKGSLVPDSYMSVGIGKDTISVYLEVDMGTESHQVFGRKIQRYLAGAPIRGGHGVSDGILALVVTDSPARMTNLIATTRRQGGGGHFLFSTLDRVTRGDFLSDPIWDIEQDLDPICLGTASCTGIVTGASEAEGHVVQMEA
jgi:hypothetical protein